MYFLTSYLITLVWKQQIIAYLLSHKMLLQNYKNLWNYFFYSLILKLSLERPDIKGLDSSHILIISSRVALPDNICEEEICRMKSLKIWLFMGVGFCWVSTIVIQYIWPFRSLIYYKFLLTPWGGHGGSPIFVEVKISSFVIINPLWSFRNPTDLLLIFSQQNLTR